MNDLPVNSVIVNVDVSVVGKQWGEGEDVRVKILWK
jgi:hypothetical protein